MPETQPGTKIDVVCAAPDGRASGIWPRETYDSGWSHPQIPSSTVAHASHERCPPP